ncbi:hypothetical protein B296_00026457, partial [Ensete ventricosum]
CYRTMQTAVGVFEGDGYEDGVNNTPTLMVENIGDSGRPAICGLNCPPFMAVEDCREQLIENAEDVLWKADTEETNEEVAARGVKFISWLCTLKEKEIAVVTHSASYLANVWWWLSSHHYGGNRQTVSGH